MSKYFSSRIYRAVICGFVFAFGHPVWSQEVIELPVPVSNAGIEEVTADFFLEPQDAVASIAGDEFETLTRGPLHEAFAEPIVADPAPGFVVAVEPPQPINELMPEFRPDGDDAIWIAGYWGWDEQREDFIWISGVFRVPPVGHQWVPGYWHQVSDGWQWVQGFWVQDRVESIAYLPAPPATLENGPSSPSPGVDYFYIPGNWSQTSSGFAWNTGYWHLMQDDLVWVPSHTVWTPRGCVYVAGYWDHRLPLRGLCFAPVSVSRVTYSRPGWCLRPNVVLNSQIVLQNLFVQPGYNHYLFGDYYGLPANHRHVVPAYVYHQKHGSCDPLISFYSAYNLRQGQDMIRWCGNHYADLNRNPEKRPAHHWSPDIANNNLDAQAFTNDSLRLAHSLDQVNKMSSGVRVSAVPLSAQQNFLKRDLEHKQLAKDRELSERIKPGQGVQTLALPKSEITRRKSESTSEIRKLPDTPRYTPFDTQRNAARINSNLNTRGTLLQGNSDLRENDPRRTTSSPRPENSVPFQPGSVPFQPGIVAPPVPRRIDSRPKSVESNRDRIRAPQVPLSIEQLGRVLAPNPTRPFDAPRRPDVPDRRVPNSNAPITIEQNNRIKEQSRRFEPPKIPSPNSQKSNALETRNRSFTPPAGPTSNPKPPILPQPRRQENPPSARTNSPSPSQPDRQFRLGSRPTNDRGNPAQNDSGKKPR